MAVCALSSTLQWTESKCKCDGKSDSGRTKMLLMEYCYVSPAASHSIAVALLNSKNERKLK